MLVERITQDDADRAASLLADRLAREIQAGRPWRRSFIAPGPLAGLLRRSAAGPDGRISERGTTAGFIHATERRDPPWLPSMWIDYLDHAATSAEAYRYLYADAASEWVARGCMDHYVVVPALDDVVEAFFELGFGLEQVYAIRSLDEVEVRDGPGVIVRRGVADDLPGLMHVLDLIAVYQEGSPVFGVNTITQEELEEGHRELLEDPATMYWVAQKGEGLVGYAIFEPIDLDRDPYLPERTIALNVAAVAEGERRTGIGSALTSAGLRAASQQGFTHCITDWRSPNLTSGPVWTRWGFEPYAYRLHRTIDPRLAP